LSADWTLIVAVALMLPLSGVSLLGRALFELADSRAEDVREGRPLRPVEIEGVTLLDVRADRVRLASIGAPPPGVPRVACVLYLGKSGGQVFVYLDDRTLRIPEASVVLQTGPDGSGC
jgi:hypothetical protein